MEFRILNKSGLQRKVDKTEQFLSESTGYIANELDSLNDDILEFETDINEFLSGLDWKEAVDTYDDIATTYPNPEDGWTVSVKDTNYVYRYNGTEWVSINVSAIPDATEQNKGLMTTTQASKLYDLHDYVLPIATGTELGGLRTDNDTLVTDANGVALAKGLTKNMPDLRDTVIGNLVGGQVLTYDEEHRVWRNAARGGIDVELDDVSGASISSDSAQRKVFLTWTDPSDVVISGVTLAEWDGTKVVRKEGSAPNDINDGVLITDSKIRDQYSSVSLTDSSVSFGIMYYYRFFPYSKKSRVTNGTVLSVRLQEESVEIPTVVGTYTYNGNQQTVVLSSNTGFTLSGNVSATNAGTYTAYATLDTGYVWSDGTYEVKEIQWTIAKANSDIIATPNVVYINPDHLTNTSSISNLLGRSIVSATSSDETVATATFNSATITISHVNQTGGNAIITVTTDASTNYNVSTIQISVEASFISLILNENSWETINAAAIDGTASSLWNVGDRKGITFTNNIANTTINGATYYLYIIGFNHNATYTGGNSIHFQYGFGSLYEDNTSLAMWSSSSSTDSKDWCLNMQAMTNNQTGSSRGNMYTNQYGWLYSRMRQKTIKEFDYSCLPTDFKNVLSYRAIYTNNKGSGSVTESDITKTYDRIYLPSEFEVFGSIRNYSSSPYEENKQTQFLYYANGNSKIKYRHSSTSTNAYWWLRSPRLSNYEYCVTTNSNSSCGSNNAQISYGFAPIFIVGKMNYDEVPSWSSATDAQIVEALTAHYNGEINLHEVWNVGDERIIHLSGDVINEDVTMVLMDHGGKMLDNSYEECLFVVGQKNCLSITRGMNNVSSSLYGWGESKIRTWLHSIYKASIPSTLVDIFKPFVNFYANGTYGTSYYGSSITDTFSLPSIIEIFGSDDNNLNTPDMNYNHIFEYYRNENNRYKKLGDSGSNNPYWTRMVRTIPNATPSTFFYSNGVDGTHYQIADYYYGIAPFGVI